MTDYRLFNFEQGEILNFYKPAGVSSFYLVKRVRALAGVKKVGHAGTLDPFADGVLLLCTGNATKKITQLMNLTKEYIGKIRLGLETDSDDVTGKIISRTAIPQLSLKELNSTCQEFVGEIPQVPPIFSAKKVSGRRLYTFARNGETIEIPPKKVTIHSLEILDLRLPFIEMKIVCSKGTYIRSIARDLGRKLMVGAYLHSLTRTRIGDYSIGDALTVVQFERMVKSQGK